MSNSHQVVVLMGVSGSGKTAVGTRLSEQLGWSFYDGDDFHPRENVEKMASGIPLDDGDRTVWLAALHEIIAEHLVQDQSMLLACSALKKKYRDQLAEGNPGTVFVYLKGDFDLIFERMQTRTGHYMQAEMLRSQFDTLEEPGEALLVDVNQSLDTIVSIIITQLSLLEK
jgi:gluconokinase